MKLGYIVFVRNQRKVSIFVSQLNYITLAFCVTGQYFGPCKCCDMYYHAECLGRDEEKLLKEKQEGKPFFCNWAQPFDIFTKKWGQVEENAHFEKIETKFQESLQQARDKNSTKIPKRKEKHQMWYDKRNNVNNAAPTNGLPVTQPPDVYLKSSSSAITKFCLSSPQNVLINNIVHNHSVSNSNNDGFDRRNNPNHNHNHTQTNVHSAENHNDRAMNVDHINTTGYPYYVQPTQYFSNHNSFLPTNHYHSNYQHNPNHRPQLPDLE